MFKKNLITVYAVLWSKYVGGQCLPECWIFGSLNLLECSFDLAGKPVLSKAFSLLSKARSIGSFSSVVFLYTQT